MSVYQPMFLLNQLLLKIYIEIQTIAGIKNTLTSDTQMNLIDKRKNKIVKFDQLQTDQTYIIEP